MATTKMEGISTSSHLEHAIGYIQSEKKTEYGKYVSCMNCTPQMAYLEFKMINKKYGKNQEKGKERDKWMAYHVHQNFDPNEKITPELAHEIGVKLAQELYGEYQCVVTTHVDRLHIHNHIIFNSVSYETGKKFNRCTKNTMLLRNTSDELCKKYNLTILKEYEADNIKDFYRVNEKSKSKKYYETEIGKNNKYSSWKEVIKADINEAIKTSKSFDEFVSCMEQIGYEIKYKNVQHIAFKAPGQKKFTRGETIDEQYSKESIKKQIDLLYQIRKEEVPKGQEEKILNERAIENHSQQKEIIAYKNRKIRVQDVENISPKWRKIVTIHGEIKYEKRTEIETSLILLLKLLIEEKNNIVVKTHISKKIDSRIEVVHKEIEQGIENLNFITENNITSTEEIESNLIALKEEWMTTKESIRLLEEKLQEYQKIERVVEKCLQLRSILNENSELYEYNLKEERKTLEMAEKYLKQNKMDILMEKEDIYNSFKANMEIKRRENKNLNLKLNDVKNRVEKCKNVKSVMGKIEKSKHKFMEKREKNR